ncbi:phage/plasmid replication protein [Bacillaceae bacterium IKA-2]|nr:phage/plasmid replication protein [Bacillaceae bacterium IKA-2]
MIGIDTIEIRTNGPLQKRTLEKMAAQKTSVTFNNPSHSHYTTYQFRFGGGKDDRMPLLKYTKENQNIKLIIPSLPYFILGSSLRKIEQSNVTLVYEKIAGILSDELGVKIINRIDEWNVTKADLYFDFQVENDVGYYIKALSTVPIQGYKTGNIAKETVYWQNNSRDIKFYDKHSECVAKQKNKVDIELSKGILRFEVSVTPKEFTATIDCEEPKLNHFLSEKRTNELLTKYLSRVNMDNLYITTEGEMRSILTEKYGAGMAHNIVSYIKAMHDGYKSVSRATMYRYNVLLKAEGLAPILGEKQLKPLSIFGNQSA